MSWSISNLGKIGEFKAGFGFPTEFQGRTIGDFPFAKVGDISAIARSGEKFIGTAGNYVDNEDLSKIKAKTIPEGTIVFAKIGEAISQNFRAVTSCEMLIDNNTMGLIPDLDIVDVNYLFHFMCKLDLYRFTGATTVPALRKSTLEEIEIPLPPLTEQKRIAAILDKADAIRRKRRQAIQLADEFLRSVFLDMFGDPVTNPKGWPEICIGELISDWTPGVTIKPNDFTESGFSVLHKGAVQKNGQLEFDTKKRTCTSNNFEYKNKKSIISNDFIAVNLRDLVPSGPSIGLMADLSIRGKRKYLLAYGAYGFKVNRSEVCPEFLVALTNNLGFRESFKKVSVGSTQIHIRKEDFFGLKVPFPEYELQSKYQNIVSNVRRLTLKQESSQAERDLFLSLSQKAFLGEI